MARIRSIHPAFWTSVPVSKLSHMGRLLFLGMLTDADDYGVLKAEPSAIRVKTFPYDIAVTDDDVLSQIAVMMDLGLVERCDATAVKGGKVVTVWVITGFREHQSPKKPSRKFVLLSDALEGMGEKVPHQYPTSTEPVPQEYPRDRDRERDREREKELLLPADAGKVIPNGNHDHHFDEFWKAYPKGHQGSKAAARKNFIKAVAGGVDPEAIIAGARAYARFLASQENPPKTKYPQGWLTERRWEVAYLGSAAGPAGGVTAGLGFNGSGPAPWDTPKPQEGPGSPGTSGGISDTREPFRALTVAPEGNQGDSGGESPW